MINSTVNSDETAMEALTPDDLQFLYFLEYKNSRHHYCDTCNVAFKDAEGCDICYTRNPESHFYCLKCDSGFRGLENRRPELLPEERSHIHSLLRLTANTSLFRNQEAQYDKCQYASSNTGNLDKHIRYKHIGTVCAWSTSPVPRAVDARTGEGLRQHIIGSQIVTVSTTLSSQHSKFPIYTLNPFIFISLTSVILEVDRREVGWTPVSEKQSILLRLHQEFRVTLDSGNEFTVAIDSGRLGWNEAVMRCIAVPHSLLPLNLEHHSPQSSVEDFATTPYHNVCGKNKNPVAGVACAAAANAASFPTEQFTSNKNWFADMKRTPVETEPAVRGVLGSIKTLKEDSAKRLYSRLQHYVDSKEKKTGNETAERSSLIEYWPLIKVVFT
ncbi:hypothetical protein F5Y06DRAFT_306836 [Hypoxylon sp. FL0890]|nr:hypothetical protein F5Y06DRAFT_306836 [Hypoxylon sp. FL0890]